MQAVSNGNGYLARIHCESTWTAHPSVLFALMTHPDNAALFRGGQTFNCTARDIGLRKCSSANVAYVAYTDIERVENRVEVSSEAGLKVVEVDQIGALKILWMRRMFRTR